MDKNKKDQSKSLLGKPGPVQLSSGQKGDKHLFTSTGKTGYTSGVPYDEKKYVTEVIGEDYKVPTAAPSTVKTGAAVPHMGVSEAPSSLDTMMESLRPEPSRVEAEKWSPYISPRSLVDSRAIVRGNVKVGDNVCIAAGAVISGHEDEPIVIGAGCSIFEGVLITMLPVRVGGSRVSGRLVNVAGAEFPVYVGDESVICAGAQLTGPCYVGRGCLVGMGAHIFWAKIGDGCIIEPGAFVMNIEIPPGYFVPSGMKVTTKEYVSKLPKITDRYRFAGLGKEMHAEIRGRQRG